MPTQPTIIELDMSKLEDVCGVPRQNATKKDCAMLKALAESYARPSPASGAEPLPECNDSQEIEVRGAIFAARCAGFRTLSQAPPTFPEELAACSGSFPSVFEKRLHHERERPEDVLGERRGSFAIDQP